MNDFISIILHDGDKPEQSITVHLSDSLRVLDDQISTKGQRFLFSNGSLLMPSFSFNYFNIHSGDHVFVVRPQNSHINTYQSKKQPGTIQSSSAPTNFRQYLKMINNSHRMHNKQLKLLGGASLIHEASRLSDLAADQFESQYPSILHNIQTDTDQIKTESMPKDTLVIPSQNLTQPSSAALPSLWS